MFLGLIVAAALTQAPEAARPPTPPLTAWSCTVDTLSSQKECVFESDAHTASDHAGQRAANLRFSRDLAKAACEKTLRAEAGDEIDAALQKRCERSLTQAATESCGLGGAWELVDGKGRFAPSAKPCYQALSAALQRISLEASISSRCCRCLASECKGVNATCYSHLTSGEPSASERSCLQRSCSDACSSIPLSDDRPQANASHADAAETTADFLLGDDHAL